MADDATTRYVIDPDASQVWIDGSSSIHPVRATATGLTGWLDLSGTGDDATIGAELRIDVERLKSGNPLVDRETRRRIDAGHYPEIIGTVTASASEAGGKAALTGDLAFRGETRSVSGDVMVKLADGELTVAGEQTFDVRDWGLSLPRLGLLRVHPDVTVRIQLVARAQP